MRHAGQDWKYHHGLGDLGICGEEGVTGKIKGMCVKTFCLILLLLLAEGEDNFRRTREKNLDH